jgi:aminopeptidase N/puromycin-sensitive aminopeptidase
VVAEAPSTSAPERILLVGDRLALMQAGQSSVGEYMNLATRLRNDPNADVLEQSFEGLRIVGDRIADEAQAKQVNAWERRTFGPVYASLGPEKPGETEADSLRRARLLQLLGAAGDPAAIAEARSDAERILAGGAVNPELAEPSLAIAARYGDIALYEKVQAEFEKETDPGKKTRAMRALADFEKPELVRRTLDYATSGKVRNQDSAGLMASLLSRPQTRREAWAYMKENWDKVQAQFTTFSGARLVGATGTFCSVSDESDVEQFFASHRVAASDRALRRALQSMDSCIELHATQAPKLAEWLATEARPEPRSDAH